ncbi:MAG: sugar ABC transporter permease [Lachnospiraceae bacterium]|nr:sugar ABC transporter permease [Lachnospiraceae bacterium]
MKIIVAICSALVWGSGQAINKQKLKGLVLFFLQAILLFTELSTGTLNVIRGISEPTFRNFGYFTKGLWGLLSLGEIPRPDSSVLIYDHSIMLMVGGIISMTILSLFALVYIWNIIDAYRGRILLEKGSNISSIDYAKKLWKNSFEYIMITPGTILVLFIIVIPILFTILLAFTNYSATAIPPRNLVDWTGFKTFVDIVKIPIWSTTFFGVFTWNVVWALAATFSAYVLGLLMAVLINAKGIRFKALWRGIYILPWAMPALVSILVFRAMFNGSGAFNQILLNTGLISEAIPFLSNAGWARASAIMVNTWISFPYFMALISGVMTAISPELYEAVDIDGGNGWHKFRFISLPMILTATAPQIVMGITSAFNNFGIIYFLTEGGPANPHYQIAGSTDLLISWIFKLTYENRMYNYAAAVSIMIFVMLAVIGGFNLMRTRAFKED